MRKVSFRSTGCDQPWLSPSLARRKAWPGLNPTCARIKIRPAWPASGGFLSSWLVAWRRFVRHAPRQAGDRQAPSRDCRASTVMRPPKWSGFRFFPVYRVATERTGRGWTDSRVLRNRTVLNAIREVQHLEGILVASPQHCWRQESSPDHERNWGTSQSGGLQGSERQFLGRSRHYLRLR